MRFRGGRLTYKGMHSHFLCFLCILPTLLIGQAYDTISNWDGITQDWQVYAGGSVVVPNPYPDSINPSGHCFRVTTTSGEYDLMFYDLPQLVSFSLYPKYRLTVYAPFSGGDVVLKFENSTNTEWEEILMTPVPGQWSILEFDFTGKPYPDFTRMVIFFDFKGTVAGIPWYIDDIIRMPGEPLELNSNLPVIVISTNGVAIPDKYKIPAHMGVIWNGNDSINHLGDPFNHYNGSIGIEIRGQSSQMFPKKSYAVETRDSSGANLDFPLLGMPGENDWVLYAPYSDKSMLRNTISFEMARRMSGYHSRSRFCEMVINDDYKGLYVLMEKIKKDSNRVDIATLNPDEISGDDLTGGYIVKVDKTDDGFVYGINGWESSPVPPYPNAKKITFQYYYPEAEVLVPNQKSYLQTYILSVENTLTRTGFSDPENGYHKYIDVPSFIDMMLINEISKEVDKYKYSTYFFKDKESKGGKLFAGPAWDFDLGYGNVDYWFPGIIYTGWAYDLVCLYEGCPIFYWKRLMEDNYFRDLAKTRWEKLRQGKLSDDNITAMIDSIVTLIDSAQMRNFERWPILGKYVWPNYNWENNDYEDEVEYFRNFLFNRLHWIDNYLPGSVLHPWAGISGEGKKIRLKLYDDYFRTNILEPEDFTLNNGPPGATITVLDYLGSSECAMAISADLKGYPDFSVTINKKVLNTYDDLISNKLSAAGIEDITEKTDISIFQVNREVHIVSSYPEKLPDEVKILNLTGQTECTYRLEKIRENIITPSLAEGLYLFLFKQSSGYTIKKVPFPAEFRRVIR